MRGMIDVRDLSKGVWVYVDGRPSKVIEYFDNWVSLQDADPKYADTLTVPDALKPIPLSEETLKLVGLDIKQGEYFFLEDRMELFLYGDGTIEISEIGNLGTKIFADTLHGFQTILKHAYNIYL